MKRVLPPHPFVADPDAPDWRQHLTACRRCGMPSANRVHQYEEPDDDSDRILGEREDVA